MPNIVYGVDADKKFNTIDVRNAIVACFIQAHDEILSQMADFAKTEMTQEELNVLKKIDVEMLIKEFFNKVGGDYENPDKKSLILVASKLKEFAQNFRAEKIVDKHYDEIMVLINKLD